MSDARTFVIVGASLAGAKAAEALRSEGFEGRVVLIGEEPVRPYERPPLSKDYLRGEAAGRVVVVAAGWIGCEVAASARQTGAEVAMMEGAGLELGSGVLTDDLLATSAPGLFAAGDVANAWHPLLERRVRLEHWSSALNQGPAAARNMLGAKAPYEKIPYFFSDQYDVGMEYSGLADPSDEVVLRGDPASRELVAFFVREGRVEAAMNVNVWDVADDLARLVASRRAYDPAELGDPDVELGRFAGQG